MDDALLADYISTFYGYGNYAGRWWLVGMEEDGGETPQEIEERLQLWDGRGRRELEDVDLLAGNPETRKRSEPQFGDRPFLQLLGLDGCVPRDAGVGYGNPVCANFSSFECLHPPAAGSSPYLMSPRHWNKDKLIHTMRWKERADPRHQDFLSSPAFSVRPSRRPAASATRTRTRPRADAYAPL